MLDADLEGLTLWQDAQDFRASGDCDASALRLKVFGNKSYKSIEESVNHPWASEAEKFCSSSLPCYCAHAVFGTKPPDKGFSCKSLCEFKLNRGGKILVISKSKRIAVHDSFSRHNGGITPDEFNFYEKRGYVERI